MKKILSLVLTAAILCQAAIFVQAAGADEYAQSIIDEDFKTASVGGSSYKAWANSPNWSVHWGATRSISKDTTEGLALKNFTPLDTSGNAKSFDVRWCAKPVFDSSKLLPRSDLRVTTTFKTLDRTPSDTRTWITLSDDDCPMVRYYGKTGEIKYGGSVYNSTWGTIYAYGDLDNAYSVILDENTEYTLTAEYKYQLNTKKYNVEYTLIKTSDSSVVHTYTLTQAMQSAREADGTYTQSDLIKGNDAANMTGNVKIGNRVESADNTADSTNGTPYMYVKTLKLENVVRRVDFDELGYVDFDRLNEEAYTTPVDENAGSKFSYDTLKEDPADADYIAGSAWYSPKAQQVKAEMFNYTQTSDGAEYITLHPAYALKTYSWYTGGQYALFKLGNIYRHIPEIKDGEKLEISASIDYNTSANQPLQLYMGLSKVADVANTSGMSTDEKTTHYSSTAITQLFSYQFIWNNSTNSNTGRLYLGGDTATNYHESGSSSADFTAVLEPKEGDAANYAVTLTCVNGNSTASTVTIDVAKEKIVGCDALAIVANSSKVGGSVDDSFSDNVTVKNIRVEKTDLNAIAEAQATQAAGLKSDTQKVYIPFSNNLVAPPFDAQIILGVFDADGSLQDCSITNAAGVGAQSGYIELRMPGAWTGANGQHIKAFVFDDLSQLSPLSTAKSAAKSE